MSTLNTALARVPALRVALPFSLGIIAHGAWHSWWPVLLLIGLSVVGYLLIAWAGRSPEQRLRWRHYFIIPLAVAAMALGWMAALIHCPAHMQPQQMQNRLVIGRIVELEHTDFSTRMTVMLLDKDVRGNKVLVSTRGCNYALRAGDVITWQLALREVGNMGNPDEMDYAAHLIHVKGIRYQQHLPISKIHKAGHKASLSTRLAGTRRQLASLVFNSLLSVRAQHLVAALLLGESGLIDPVTRQDFSSAGIAHVLALSGLHIGIIALIIWWLLFPLDYLRLKWLRLMITLAFIVLFALFTGLSPSVMRSAVMTAVAFIAVVIHRRSSPLNSLCVAALAILLFAPFSLYSVGFQLSFTTVAAVLLFHDLPSECRTGIRLVDSLAATAFTSLVAMMATIGLVAHYFHTVSVASVITNLLVLPVLPFFMILGALFLLVSAGGMRWALLDRVIDTVSGYIHGTATMVNSIPLLHTSGVYVSTVALIAYFVIIILLVLWLVERRYSCLLAAAFALMVTIAHSLWIDMRTPTRGLVVFNSYNSTPVFYYDQGEGFLWVPDEADADVAAFSRYHSGFLARHGIHDVTLIDHDTVLTQEQALFKPPFAHLMGKRLLEVHSNRRMLTQVSGRIILDALVITKRYHGKITKLKEMCDCGNLIISGAMPTSSLQPLLAEADSLGIACHALGRDGAWFTAQ